MRRMEGASRLELAGKAAVWGNAAEYHRLKCLGADANCGPRVTAMYDAVVLGDARAMRALIDVGLDVNAEINGFNESFLHRAVDVGHDDAVRVLLDAGADVDARDAGRRTPAHDAVYAGRARTLRLLVQAGADVDAEAGDEGPLVVHATTGARAEVLQVLIDAGADVNGVSEHDYRALPKAIMQNRDSERLVSMLIAAGANVNEPDADGNTPLFKAVEYDNLAAVRMLLAAGGDVHRCNDESVSVMHLVAMAGREEDTEDSVNMAMYRLLADAGVGVEVRDVSGYTPATWAAACGNFALLRAMMRAGADVEALNLEGESAVDFEPRFVRRVQRCMALWAWVGRSRTRIVCQLGGDPDAGSSSDSRVQAKVDVWLDVHGLAEWREAKCRPHLAHYKRAKLA